MQLPPPSDSSRPYAIAVVCLGNICRSPTAQVVLDRQLAAAGLHGRVRVSSAGTGDWHVGEPMDPRAAAELRAAGYDPSRHRARQVDVGWFGAHDLLLAMDLANHADLLALAPTAEGKHRVAMFRAWDPEHDPAAEVPDPWYGGPDGFAEVLTMVERTAAVLVTALAEHVRRSGAAVDEEPTA